MFAFLFLWSAQGVLHPEGLSFQLNYKSHSPGHHTARRLLPSSGNVPVYGNAQVGYYWTYVYVGGNDDSSHKPQQLSVILDTGSALFAVACEGCKTCGKHMDKKYNPTLSPTAKPVGCQDTQCTASRKTRCTKGTCHYYVSYSEGSSIQGHVMSDIIWFAETPGVNSTDESEYLGGIRTAIGCHEKETKLFVSQDADGIMGMNANNLIQEQLFKQHIIHTRRTTFCLARSNGYLTFGGDKTYGVTLPLTISRRGFYLVSLQSISLNSVKLSATMGQLNSGLGCVLDTGTTFTYVASQAFHSFYDNLGDLCAGSFKCAPKARRASRDEIQCYSMPSDTSASKLDEWFPVVGLHFERASLLIRPKQYLWMAKQGVWCVGVYNNNNDGTVIGANFVVDYEMMFDLDQNMVGFAATNCSDGAPLSVGYLPGVSRTTVAVGMVITLFVILLVCGVACWCCWRRRKNKAKQHSFTRLATNDDDADDDDDMDLEGQSRLVETMEMVHMPGSGSFGDSLAELDALEEDDEDGPLVADSSSLLSRTRPDQRSLSSFSELAQERRPKNEGDVQSGNELESESESEVDSDESSDISDVVPVSL